MQAPKNTSAQATSNKGTAGVYSAASDEGTLSFVTRPNNEGYILHSATGFEDPTLAMNFEFQSPTELPEDVQLLVACGLIPDIEAVRKLGKKLDMNKIRLPGINFTPLDLAARRHQKAIIQTLIEECKADPKIGAPVVWACYVGNVEIASMLSENYGAPVNAQLRSGATALQYAAENRQMAAVKWLVKEKKVDVICRGLNGKPLVEHLKERNLSTPEIIQFLRERYVEALEKRAVDIESSLPQHHLRIEWTQEDPGMLEKDCVAILEGLMNSSKGTNLRGLTVPMLGPNLGTLLSAIALDQMVKRDPTFARLHRELKTLSTDRGIKELLFIPIRSGGSPGRHVVDPKLRPDYKIQWLHTLRPPQPLDCDIDAFRTLINVSKVLFRCVHSQEDEIMVCQQCLMSARIRIIAASSALYAFSVQHTNPGYGASVIYFAADKGKRVVETFKCYAHEDVKFTVTCIANSNPIDLFPLWVAQDPMLYWNIVAHFGSVRAAAESCAPQCNWDSLWGPRPTTALQLPVTAAESFPANVRNCLISKCMAPECTMISAGMLSCAKCRTRKYCSPACQKGDWPAHKLECAKLAALKTKK